MGAKYLGLAIVMDLLSIIIPIGFVNQQVLRGVKRGDEIDHLAPVIDVKSPVELVIVDAAWPSRWDRIQEVLGEIIDKVRYVSPKPSVIFDYGYRSTSNTRNSGAIVSLGDLLIFVDDFILVDSESIDAVCEEFENTGRLLHPTLHKLPVGRIQRFTGHNGGIYLSSRKLFMMTEGFDENFDGSYGEEDIDFEVRLDAVIRKMTGQNALRIKRYGVKFSRTPHKNGRLVKPMGKTVPFWDGGLTDAHYMRCNRAYFKFVKGPRANRTLTREQVDMMRGKVCASHCGPCRRNDREHQILSYSSLVPDKHVSDKMKLFIKMANLNKLPKFGSYNPWNEIK